MKPGIFFPFLFFLLLNFTAFSQIDKEFWFVGPEASANHGDIPVFLRISTMDEPANITLRMPANNKFIPVKNLIPPNSTFSIRLDNIDGDATWLDSIENRPPDMILNKGLLLTADKYVTSYYEINNGSNPAIFPFKGKNGMGLDFYIPGQTNYANQTNNGSEAFDIVATRDTTLITITPTIDIVGHPANVPFQIILNKGETYSARTLITTASASLAGSHVVANKPVAITISDDSIITGGWDIIGDQIIPINLLGTEYIAIKGYANNSPPANNDERVYILAVEDGTEIRIDGSAVPVATLNAGEQYNHGIPTETNTAYISAGKPVYVYHLTGHPGEAGASILPHDSCTGSRKVGFNRSSASAFAMMILTRAGNEGSFQLNGNNSIITAASFSPVPGTSGNWMYYRQNNMTITQVPQGANLLENSNGKFHLGILNNVGASSEYGYFSDFSTLFLGTDASMCPGDSVVLDGGPFRTSYEWKKLVAGSWITVGTNQTYIGYDSGFYACITNGDFCTLMDSIRVDYYPNASVDLGSDRTICQGTTTNLAPGNYQSYEWSDGSAAPTLTTGNYGEIWVRVVNNNGCVALDTIMINIDSLPLANHLITGSANVCQGQQSVPYSIEALDYATSYQWIPPPGASGASSTNSISLNFGTSAASGNLELHGLNSCGSGPAVIFPVNVNPLPGAAGIITAPDSVCQVQAGIVISIPPVPDATTYSWNLPSGFNITASAGNTITVTAGINAVSGVVSVHGVNNCGNGPGSEKFIHAGQLPQPAGLISGSQSVCQGQAGVIYSILAIPGADSYTWNVPAGAVIMTGNETNLISVTFDSTAVSGQITVKGHNITCGDGLLSAMAVFVNPLPSPAGIISGPGQVCQGQTGVVYSIQPVSNASTYTWTLPPGSVIQSGSGTSQVTVNFGIAATQGILKVGGYNSTCGYGRQRSLLVLVNPLPLPPGDISGAATVCQGDQHTIYTVSQPDPQTTSYTWTITPSMAGIASGTTSATDVAWNESFSGIANLTVRGINGCGSGPVSQPMEVTVNYRPWVDFANGSDLVTTKNGQPILLKGGTPMGPGGSYLGTGVMETIPGTWYFDPGNSAVFGSSSGTNYTITYRYANAFNCFREATRNVKVYLSNAGQPCPGTMMDVRDEKTYPVFLAGYGPTARCWMAENLDYGLFSSWNQPQTDNSITEKYCAENLESNCSHFGGYYYWEEIMEYGTAEGSQGICPPGWHVPTRQEWDNLRNYYLGPGIAGNALKDQAVAHGFHGLITGIGYQNNLWNFSSGSNQGSMFWSSTTLTGYPLAFGLNSINPSVSEYPSRAGNAFQVRCVRD